MKHRFQFISLLVSRKNKRYLCPICPICENLWFRENPVATANRWLRANPVATGAGQQPGSGHHAGGDSERGADGREDADDGLDDELQGLFLGHGYFNL